MSRFILLYPSVHNHAYMSQNAYFKHWTFNQVTSFFLVQQWLVRVVLTLTNSSKLTTSRFPKDTKPPPMLESGQHLATSKTRQPFQSRRALILQLNVINILQNKKKDYFKWWKYVKPTVAALVLLKVSLLASQG